MSWVLVIMVHAGMLSSKDSIAVTNIQGFKTEFACMQAGKASTALGKGTTKDVAYVCLKQE